MKIKDDREYTKKLQMVLQQQEANIETLLLNSSFVKKWSKEPVVEPVGARYLQ